MEHGEKHITVIDENGNEQLCEVLFTFESEALCQLWWCKYFQYSLFGRNVG